MDTNSNTGHEARQPSAQAATGLESLRERVRLETIKQLRGRNFSVSAIREVIEDILEDALAGIALSDASESSRRINAAIEGVSEGLQQVAHVAGLVLEEALAKKQTFLADDLETVTDALKSLESTFVQTCSGFVSRIASAVESARGIALGLKEAGQRLRAPAARASEVASDIMTTGSATIVSGTKAARELGLQFVFAASGMLDIASKLLLDRKDPSKLPVPRDLYSIELPVVQVDQDKQVSKQSDGQ